MGLRIIRKVPDEILEKPCREVKNINDRIKLLLDDMVETMHEDDGIGLAGPQVGVLRRIFVADVGDGNVYRIINPEIIEKEGEDIDIEGCLSIPNFRGTVKRAEKIKMKYLDENGEQQIIEADGLLARCFQHEYDHLDGVLITSKFIEEIKDDELEEWIEKKNKEREKKELQDSELKEDKE